MNGILSSKLEGVRKICECHRIKTLSAFGSVCTDRFSDTSDIDLFVSFLPSKSPKEYADRYFSAAEQFEHLFGRPVDLVTDAAAKNPFFRDEIRTTEVLLYGQ